MTAAARVVYDDEQMEWVPLERAMRATRPEDRDIMVGDFMWMGAVDLVDYRGLKTQVELVVVGVGHDHPFDVALADVDASRSEFDEAVDFVVVVDASDTLNRPTIPPT